MKPLVSIIIPCFNAEELVGDAIRSALGQTWPHIEVIVIDDGSTDQTVEVLRSFGDSIRWHSQPNRGAPAARNRGLEIARGELVQFLDADDLLDAGKVEACVNARASSGADVVFCNGRSDPPAPFFDRLYQRSFDGGDPVPFVLGGAIPTSAPLHSREILRELGGFREELPCAQERDLHLRLACEGLRFHHVPEVLFTVRRQPGSLSSDSTRVIHQHLGISTRAWARLADRAGQSEERARAFAGWLAADARALLRQGLQDRAERYFREARRIHRDGGLPEAYGRPARMLRSFLGAELAERVVSMKRRLATRLGSGVLAGARAGRQPLR